MSLTTGAEIKPRANTLEKIGATPLTNDQINHLKNYNRRNLIEHLGIDVGENWNNSIPFTGLTLRIYVMQKDANGQRDKDAAAEMLDQFDKGTCRHVPKGRGGRPFSV